MLRDMAETHDGPEELIEPLKGKAGITTVRPARHSGNQV